MLVRAPPMSGKTSLWELFGRFLTSSDPRIVVIRLSFLQLGPRDSTQEPNVWFREGFRTHCIDCRSESYGRYDWNGILSPEGIPADVPVVLLLDESQMAYNMPELALWAAVKSFQFRNNRFCVFFGAYGGRTMSTACATPVSFADEAVWSFSNLRFVREEREEVFRRLQDIPEASYVHPLPLRMCSRPIAVPFGVRILLPVRRNSELAEQCHWRPSRTASRVFAYSVRALPTVCFWSSADQCPNACIPRLERVYREAISTEPHVP